jgi:hypothetical protein
MTGTLTPLEEQRLHELTAVVAARAADLPSIARSRSRRAYLRPALALGTIGAAAAAVLAFTAGHPVQNAGLAGYTIHQAADGVVTIRLTDFKDVSQLSAELAADHIPAAVYAIPVNQVCQQPGAVTVPPQDQSMPYEMYSLPQGDGLGWSMQLNPSYLKPGQIMVFGVTYSAGRGYAGAAVEGSSTYIVTGQLGACRFTPAPARSSAPAPSPVNPPIGVTGGTIGFTTAAFQFANGLT